MGSHRPEEREREGQRPQQRKGPLAAPTKDYLQVSSFGGALGPHRAPVFLDGLSYRNLQEDVRKLVRVQLATTT